MMDSQNLQTASQYVNNLLLSRGLLRNGTPLEFANPSKGEAGKEATMAKIINLIHDLILRRDVSLYRATRMAFTKVVNFAARNRSPCLGLPERDNTTNGRRAAISGHRASGEQGARPRAPEHNAQIPGKGGPNQLQERRIP